MIYQETQNRVSYAARIREMDAEELVSEYYQLITKNRIAQHSYFLELIRKQYRQITGDDLRTIISKTA